MNGFRDYLCDEDFELAMAVREFAHGELLDLDRTCDRDESSICQALDAVAEMGLLNLKVPAELGGLGCSTIAYAAIIHELASASPSMAVTVSVHSMVGAMLLRYASPRIREELLPHWGQAASLASFAISEADAGSDPSRSSTRAELANDTWRLNGAKMWITNGDSGRWFVTLAQTKALGDKSGLCMILVDGRQPSVERIKIRGKMGIRGSETVSLHYTDVRAPFDHLLHEQGSGMKLALGTLDGGRIGIAAQATGIAEACLREMTSYAQQREQFDQPIAQFQAIQQMVADSAMELHAAKALIARACAVADRDEDPTPSAARAKLYATEAAGRIADRAVQLHGGTGFVNDARVEQLYRDARVTRIYEGTSEIQRVVIGRALLAGEDIACW